MGRHPPRFAGLHVNERAMIEAIQRGLKGFGTGLRAAFVVVLF